jgi:flap endonuclease-1
MVKRHDGWAVSSQDYDSLLYGTPRLVQNLSVEGRRKVPGKLAFTTVEPMLVDLAENLKALDLSHEQLMWLAVLVGTDYAPGGVKGIGPKKGLSLVRQAKSPEEVFKDTSLVDDVGWRDVLDVFKSMPVTDDYSLHWSPVDKKRVYHFLVEQHDFGAERVQKTLEVIAPKQRGLGDFA